MNTNELFFTTTHEWVKWIDENTALVGLTDYAQNALGDIVFVNISEGSVEAGSVMGDIESVKAVSDIYSPLTGEIVEVNNDIIDSPELINSDCYGTWMVKISNVTVKEKLLTKQEYDALEKE